MHHNNEISGKLPQMGTRTNLLLPHPRVQLHAWPFPQEHMPNALGLHVFVPELGQHGDSNGPQYERGLAAHYATRLQYPNEFYSVKLKEHMKIKLRSHPYTENILEGMQRGVNILHVNPNGELRVSDSVRFGAGKFCDLTDVFCYWAMFCYLESTFPLWVSFEGKEPSDEVLQDTFGAEVAFMLNSMKMAGICQEFEHWTDEGVFHIQYTELGGQKVVWSITMRKPDLQVMRLGHVGSRIELRSLFPVMFRLFPDLADFKITALMTKGQMYGSTRNVQQLDDQ